MTSDSAQIGSKKTAEIESAKTQIKPFGKRLFDGTGNTESKPRKTKPSSVERAGFLVELFIGQNGISFGATSSSFGAVFLATGAGLSAVRF